MLGSARFKDDILQARCPNTELKKAFVQERAAKLKQLVKRAPDQPTITITDTNTAEYPTVTFTSTAPAETITYTMTLSSCS